jgi:hypothetical protein
VFVLALVSQHKSKTENRYTDCTYSSKVVVAATRSFGDTDHFISQVHCWWKGNMLASLASVVDSYLALDEGCVRTDLLSGEVVTIDGNLNRTVAGRLSGPASFAKVFDATRNSERYYIIVGKHKVEVTAEMDMVPKPLSVVRESTIRLTNDESRYCVIKFTNPRAFTKWLSTLGDCIAKMMCMEALYRYEPSNETACRNLQQCIHTCTLLTTPNKDYFQRIKLIHSLREKLVRVIHTLRYNPSDVSVRDIKLLKDAFLRYHELHVDPAVRKLMEQLSAQSYREEDLQVILKDILVAEDGADAAAVTVQALAAASPTAPNAVVSARALADAVIVGPSPVREKVATIHGGASAGTADSNSPAGQATPTLRNPLQAGAAGDLSTSKNTGKRSSYLPKAQSKFTTPGAQPSTTKGKARSPLVDRSILQGIVFTTAGTAAAASSPAETGIKTAGAATPTAGQSTVNSLMLVPCASDLKLHGPVALKDSTLLAASLGAQGKENHVNHATLPVVQPMNGSENVQPNADLTPIASAQGLKGDLSPLPAALAVTPRRAALASRTAVSQRKNGAVMFRAPPLSPAAPAVRSATVLAPAGVASVEKPTAEQEHPVPVTSCVGEDTAAVFSRTALVKAPQLPEFSSCATSTSCTGQSAVSVSHPMEPVGAFPPARAGAPVVAGTSVTSLQEAVSLPPHLGRPILLCLFAVAAMILSSMLGAHLAAPVALPSAVVVPALPIHTPSRTAAIPPASLREVEAVYVPAQALPNGEAELLVRFHAADGPAIATNDDYERSSSVQERRRSYKRERAQYGSVSPGTLQSTSSRTHSLVKSRLGPLRRLLALPLRAAQAVLQRVMQGLSYYRRLFEE